MTAPPCLPCPACVAADITVFDRVKGRRPDRVVPACILTVVEFVDHEPQYDAQQDARRVHDLYRVSNDDGGTWLLTACQLRKVP